MNRRALLEAIAGSATVGLAGCLTRRSSSDSERPNETTRTPDDTGTDDTPAGTDGCPDGPALVNSSFDVVSVACGDGENRSSASFETNSIHVSGTIPGSNSCYTAKLEDMTCEKETLTVSVHAYERENDDLCSMCVTDIEYESAFDFENDLPQRIVVRHDGTEVLNEPRE